MPRSEADARRFREKLMEVAQTMTFEERSKIVEVITQYLNTAEQEKSLNDMAHEIANFYRLTFRDLGLSDFDTPNLIRLILLIGIECSDTIPVAIAYFLFCKLPEGLAPAE